MYTHTNKNGSHRMTMKMFHGFGQSKESFTHKNGKLIHRFSEHFDVEVLEGLYPSTGYKEEIGGKSWWPTVDLVGDLTDKRDINVDKYLDVVKPSDVLFGFSQGGNLILRALEKNPRLCKVAIIANTLRGNIVGPIHTPVIFINGTNDPFVDKEHIEDLENVAINKLIITINGAHSVPQSKVVFDEIMSKLLVGFSEKFN